MPALTELVLGLVRARFGWETERLCNGLTGRVEDRGRDSRDEALLRDSPTRRRGRFGNMIRNEGGTPDQVMGANGVAVELPQSHMHLLGNWHCWGLDARALALARSERQIYKKMFYNCQ